jgi:glutathione S-transferase
MSPTLRVHRIPFSTNVERIALACGIKGVPVEWVDHDPADRSALVELSGQPLTPVAEFGTDVLHDSPLILERLDREHPDPPLYPRDGAARARAELFAEWFNEVWKLAPNALDANPAPTGAEARHHLARIQRHTTFFEALLSDADYLLGPELTLADVVAYPFLRYAIDEPDPADTDRFHAILHEQLSRGEHPALEAWVRRLAQLPQS